MKQRNIERKKLERRLDDYINDCKKSMEPVLDTTTITTVDWNELCIKELIGSISDTSSRNSFKIGFVYSFFKYFNREERRFLERINLLEEDDEKKKITIFPNTEKEFVCYYN